MLDTIRTTYLGIAFAMVVQAGVIVWHISMMTADIQSNSAEISKIYKRISELEKSVQAQAVYIARIDENISAIRLTTDTFFRSEVLGRFNISEDKD